jgi:hypothetical protein
MTGVAKQLNFIAFNNDKGSANIVSTSFCGLTPMYYFKKRGYGITSKDVVSV